jgi:hypothetical protein
VPARVVSGYRGGQWVQPVGGTGYVDLRQADAHAWSEVWLDGEGWRRVDPTAWAQGDPLARLGAAGAGSRADGGPLEMIILGLGRFRRPIRDYFAICDSYYQAIRRATAQEIETIDMARRGVHNEAAELLLERLEGKIETDFATARRLFTLICVLHIRG